MAPTSWKLSGSMSLVMRSRTVRRPPSCWRLTLSGPPMACAMRSRRRNSSNSRCQFIGGPQTPAIAFGVLRLFCRFSVFEHQANGETVMNRIGRVIEQIVINTRWLIVPFLLGLIVGLVALLYAFIVKLGEFVLHVRGAPEEEIFVGILKLVDFALTANLLLIVISAGYQNYIARISRRD